MNVKNPIFILSAPRSGSTLLFETLMRHKQIWSFGDEGHAWIERFPHLRPVPGGVESNRLTREHLNPALAHQLRIDMLRGLKSRQGQRVSPNSGVIRVLEKTPKNCLRVPFINTLYPDARFIYLYRDPKESVSSIMEGWRHQRFVTYGDVRTAHGRWCFLRPPRWKSMINRPIHEIAAFQWKSCQDIILNDLKALDANRWTSCSFDEFLSDPLTTVRRLVNFGGLDVDTELEAYCSSPLPNSRYTQTAPKKGKWKQHQAQIEEIFPSLTSTIDSINEIAIDGWVLDNELPANDD